MNLRDFLRLYTASALLGGLAFWPAACASWSVRSSVSIKSTLREPGPVSARGVMERDPGFERGADPVTPTLAGSVVGSTRGVRKMATAAAHLCGVPVAIFHALVQRESSWRPHVVSSAGAVGLAQVKPSTARGISPTLDVRDPWQNLVAGACYLRQQFDRFGTWREALRAYHAGPYRKLTTVATHEYAEDVMGSAQ